MADKTINVRTVQKHDTESNWNKVGGFVPKQGELIIYDADAVYSYARLKIGDGVHTISVLPFVDHATQELIDGKQDILSGVSGQVVGFDAGGNAVAQSGYTMVSIKTWTSADIK